MQRLSFRVLLGCILALGANRVLWAAQAGPKPISKAFRDAINRGDVAAALALYADDAFIDNATGGAGPCVGAPCVGKTAIEKHIKHLVDSKVRTTALNEYVSGNVLTVRTEARNDLTRKAGVERVIQWEIIEIRNGKISAVRALRERTDPESARYTKWLQEQAQKAK